MAKVVTLPLQFNGIEYYLLIQVKGFTEYHITLLTDSDSKIYGTYVFSLRNGMLCLVSQPSEITPQFTEAIEKLLRKHML